MQYGSNDHEHDRDLPIRGRTRSRWRLPGATTLSTSQRSCRADQLNCEQEHRQGTANGGHNRVSAEPRANQTSSSASPSEVDERHCSTSVTSGTGIMTDGDGRALDPFDEVILGLFAAGNTTSNPMGPGYPGAGGTLGPGMTMGYAAGRRAVNG